MIQVIRSGVFAKYLDRAVQETEKYMAEVGLKGKIRFAPSRLASFPASNLEAPNSWLFYLEYGHRDKNEPTIPLNVTLLTYEGKLYFLLNPKHYQDLTQGETKHAD